MVMHSPSLISTPSPYVRSLPFKRSAFLSLECVLCSCVCECDDMVCVCVCDGAKTNVSTLSRPDFSKKVFALAAWRKVNVSYECKVDEG